MFYINGVKASKSDIVMLFNRAINGKECILEVHKTNKGNIAVVTV